MKHSLFNKILLKKQIILVVLFFSMGLSAFAEGPKPASSVSNPFVLLLVIIAVILALVIALMAKVVLGAAGIFMEKAKQEGKETQTTTTTKTAVMAGLLVLTGSRLLAQSADSTAAKSSPVASLSSVSDTAYYMLAGVVITELLLVMVLLYMLRVFVNVKKKARVAAAGETARATAVAAKPAISWWDRFNKLKPLHEEADIDLGHNYDGIRELDNRLPPWWLYGFYITIIFAVGYLYMHHVSHTLPSNLEQYEAQVKEGELQKEAYLKKSANNVDETTVKLLTDETSLSAGKAVFQTTCFPCHGKNGEGGVGPNLTDNYWLHGGTINDVFKTIKYGWPDKGMKSWKDDFSPVQIAQIASYVKSLHGTNPANAKAPQGTLFTDSTSASATADTIQVIKKM